MPKILLLSDSAFLPTGFRNQTFLLAEKLAEDNWEVHWQAPSHCGIPIKNAVLPDGRKCLFTVHPGASRHPHSADVLQQRLIEIKPDIFFTLLDSFMLMCPEFLNTNIPCPSTLWFPSVMDLGFLDKEVIKTAFTY